MVLTVSYFLRCIHLLSVSSHSDNVMLLSHEFCPVEIQAKLSTAGPIFSFFHHAGFQFYNTCYFLKDSAFSCCIVEYFDICCDEVFCHLKSFKQELVRCSLSCYVQSLSQSVLKVDKQGDLNTKRKT